MAYREKIIEKLIKLLQSKPYLNEAVETSLKIAGEPGIETLEEFFNFLHNMLTEVPTEKELMPTVRQFYFVLSHSPENLLRKDANFNAWIQDFVVSRGEFLDTTESVECLYTFIQNPEYKIDDYINGPSGWQTFNQFLARQLKPGKRPISNRCNNSIVVSPADSECCGVWNITNTSTVTAKGITYSIAELLDGSRYKENFKNGLFTHSFLGITDYHRYHVPVGGVVTEVRKIPGHTWVNEVRKQDGSIENDDDVGFQFTHTRGCITIDSQVGLVVVMPVGMGHVSSVNITVEEGTILEKGDEFGYFAFGGSDMIMLFQENKVNFSAKEKGYYKMGEEIARANNA